MKKFYLAVIAIVFALTVNLGIASGGTPKL